MCLLTKLDEPPFYVLYYSEGSSSLVRKISGISTLFLDERSKPLLKV